MEAEITPFNVAASKAESMDSGRLMFAVSSGLCAIEDTEGEGRESGSIGNYVMILWIALCVFPW